MNELFSSIVLGFVQGISEFIPVSSSGHLVIVRDFLGINITGTLLFDIFLHVGTLCAVLVYFWSDVKALVTSTYRVVRRKAVRAEQEFVAMITLATMPAVILGFLFSGFFENTFRSSTMIAFALILGSVLMYIAEYMYKKQEISDTFPSYKKSLYIGLFQSLALIPGMSRSGATISGGMLVGLSRDKAVRFSFLLSVPIIFGAALKGLFSLGTASGVSFLPVLAGGITAFAVGLLAIHFLVIFLKNRTLKLFIWYRVILAVLILIFL